MAWSMGSFCGSLGSACSYLADSLLDVQEENFY